MTTAGGSGRSLLVLLAGSGHGGDESAGRVAQFAEDSGLDFALVSAPTEGGDEDPRILKARLAEVTADRDRLRAEAAELQHALLRDFTDPRRQRRHLIVLDEQFEHPAFHGFERLTPERHFRWMGRENQALFRADVARCRAVRLEVTVEIAISPEAIGWLHLGIDGHFAPPTEVVDLGEGKVRLARTADADTAADPFARRTIGLKLTGRTTAPHPDDPRMLAVGLSAITVEEISAADAAAGQRRTVAVAAGALGHAFGLRRAGGDPRAVKISDDGTVVVPVRSGCVVRVEVHAAWSVPELALDRLRIGLGSRIATRLRTERSPSGALVRSAEFRVPGPVGAGETAVPIALLPGAPAEADNTEALLLERLVVREIDEAGFVGPGAFRAEIDARSLPVAAFHDLENAAGNIPFRWMGRQAAAVVPLDAPRDQALTVTALLHHAVSQAAVDGFTVALDEVPACETEVEHPAGGLLCKRFVFPAVGGGEPAGPLRMMLRGPAAEDLSSRGDPRVLSVALHKLVVTEG